MFVDNSFPRMLPGLYCAVLFGGLLAVGSGSGSGDEDGTNLCRLPDGNFPNPDDCTSFVRCQSGVSDMESCPQGLLFNPFAFTCDFSKTGNCSNSGDFESTSASLPTTDIECPEDGPNIYSIVSSCSEYYLCDNGIAFRMACPPTLQMNPDKLTCDYEVNVECDMTSSSEETSVGITAIYETNTEDSETITDEPLIISETSIVPNTELTSAQATETPKTTVESDFSEPAKNISKSSRSVSESATTSEISSPHATEEITLPSTTLKYATSESATEYTVNKQPTVVSLSTAQTEEVTNYFTETSSEAVKLISDDETEMSEFFSESTVVIVPENNTDQNIISSKTSSDIEITDFFTSEISPDFTITGKETTVSDQFATNTVFTTISVLDVSNTNTGTSYDSEKPEVSRGTTTENNIEDKSTVMTSIDELASSVTADPETDTEEMSSNVVKYSTTAASFTTDNDSNGFTAMEIATTSELNTSMDDTTNTLTTTQNTLTTNVSSEITPEKSKTTTLTLMSSDPSTDNETIEFSTTTEYKSTDTSTSHTVESTTNSKSMDFEESTDTVTSTRLTDFEPVTEVKTNEMSTKLTSETSDAFTEYIRETTDTSKYITDAETIITSDVQPTSDDLKTMSFSSTELSSTKNVDQDISTILSTTTKIEDISEITETSQSNTFASSTTDFSTLKITSEPFASNSTESIETTTGENEVSINSTDSFATYSTLFSKETESDEPALKVTTAKDKSTADTFTTSTARLTYTSTENELETSNIAISTTHVESTFTSKDETVENTYEPSTDYTSTVKPIFTSTSTFETTTLTTYQDISKSSNAVESTTKNEDNSTTEFTFSTNFTDTDSSLSTSHLSTPSKDTSNTQTDLTPITLTNEATFPTAAFFSTSSSDSKDTSTNTFDPLSTSHTTEVTSNSSTEDTTLKYSSNDYGSKTVTTLPTTSDRTSVSIASITDVTFEETKTYSETHPDEISTKTVIPVSSTTERNIYESTFETYSPSKHTMNLRSTLNPTTLQTSTYETVSTDTVDKNISTTTSPVPLSTTEKSFISTEYETASFSLTDKTSVTNVTDYDEISTTASKLNTETRSYDASTTASALSNETLFSTNSDSSKSNTFDFSVVTDIPASSDDLATEDLTSDYTQTMTPLTSLSIETSENSVESTTIQKSSTDSEIQPDKISTLSTSTLSLITDSDTFETPTVLPTNSAVDTITPELSTIYSSTFEKQSTSQNTNESPSVLTESSTLLSTESSSEFLDRTTELNNLTNFTLVTNQTSLETLETTTILSTQFKETSTGMERTTTKLPDETPTDVLSTLSSESDNTTTTIDHTQSSKVITETSSVPSSDEATTTDLTAENSYKTVLTTSVPNIKTSYGGTSEFSSTTDYEFNKDTDSSTSQTDLTSSDIKYTSDKTSDLLGSTTPVHITVETDSENIILTTETSISSTYLPSEETSSESDYVTSTIDQTQSSKAFTETSSIPSLDETTTTDSTADNSYKTVITTTVSHFKTSTEKTNQFSGTTDSVFNKDTDSSPSQTDLTSKDIKYTSDTTSDLIVSTTPVHITVETDSGNIIFTTETSISSSDLPNKETSSENNTPNEIFPTLESTSYRTTYFETSEGTTITDGRTLSTSTMPSGTHESSSSSNVTYVTDEFSSTVSEDSTIDINTETHSTEEVTEKTNSDLTSDLTTSITSKPTKKDFSTVPFTDTTNVEDITKYISPTGFTPSRNTEIETDKTQSDYTTITEHRTSRITLPSETTTVNTICLTPYGFYPNPNDCHTFYECSKGIPKLSLCTENDHFNPITNICEDQCAAKCDPNASCPTTESDDFSKVSTLQTQTESILSSSNSHFTETGGSSLYTVITSGIQTSVSDVTFEVSTEPDASSSDFISVSESPNSTDEIVTTTITDETKYQTTTDFSSVIPSTATSKSSIAISTGDTSDDHSESVTQTYLSSTSVEKTSHSPTSNDNETESNSSTEKTSVTDGLVTSISTNELQTDITEKQSSRTDTTNSDEITDPGLFTTDDFDDSSYDTEESIDDTSLQTLSTSVTPTKCGNEGCSSTNVPVLSTPVPYRVCHLNDFLSRPNCNEYVDCTEKIPKKKECPLGLYFNPTTRVCDWPFKAGCGGSGRPLYKPDESFECPCKSCLIPSNKSCAHYYLCLGYTAYHLQCSNSLLFDKTLNTCNYSPLVNCLQPTSTTVVTRKPTTASTTKRTTPRSTTTTTTTTSQPKRFVCPSREGLFRYPGNCGMFYQCSNWYPYAMHCAATTHFSEITRNCEYPCDAKCDLTLNCGKHTTAAPRDPRCSCRNCKLPSDETCTKYIVCVNGRARLENCPWGQTYDVKRATCDWAHRVDCQRSEICPGRNGLFVHKDDCHKFVHCSNGIPYVKNCPANLEFDSIKKRCEWPAGRCSQSSIPKEFEVHRTEEQRGGWRCPKSFGYFADDHNCNKFYQCSYGTPSLKECSEGLLYNPRYQNCDWKSHVRCQSNRHYSPKKCRVYDKHATCSSDRKPLPHSHCNMYYDCTAGRACARQCPVGLYFNRTTGICDLPSNIKCFHPDKNEYSLRDFSQRCLSHDRGHMSSPADVACFYRCRRSKVISGCCSRGYVYNQHRDKCERITNSYRL